MSSPKPNRPGARHRDSFFRKIHKRHDERHHPHENRHGDEEQQPLLQEEHPDTASEVEAQAEEPTPVISSHSQTVATRIYRSVQKAKSALSSGVNNVGNAIKNNPKRLMGAALGVLLVLATGEAIDIFLHHRQPQPENSICMTPTCVEAASRILTNLHPEYQHMDPCSDFDQYVCGGFRLNHELRDSQGSIFTGSLVEDEMYMILRNVLELEESQMKEEDKSIFKKVKDSYLACTDEEKIQEYGAKPLKGIIDEIRSRFPAKKTVLRKSSGAQLTLGEAEGTPTSLTGPFIELAKFGIDAFVSLQIQANTLDHKLQTISVTPATPVGLPTTEHYQDENTLAVYMKGIEQSLEYFNPSPRNSSTIHSRFGPRLSSKDIAQGVVQLESKLATLITSDSAIAKGSNPTKLTFEEFEESFPQLSIKSVVRELGPSTYNDNTLLVPSVSYPQALSKIVSATSQDVLHGFMIWKAIQAYANFVEAEILNQWKNLARSLSGMKSHSQEDRWRICTRSVNNDFRWIMSRFYIEQQFSQQAKDSGDQLIASIKRHFGEIILGSSWMTEDDRTKSISKLDHMKSKIGFPTTTPNVKDPQSLDTFYNSVVVQNNTYLENKVQSARAQVSHQWSKLGQPTNNHEWSIPATAVDAYYDTSLNEIFIPAAIMHKPLFYGSATPSYLTYGAFGAIAGHEISHAFDSIGAKYNENGTIGRWWSNSTEAAFTEKLDCFVKQYSEYTVETSGGNLSINGNLTLSEAIADAGGLHVAYATWSQSEAQQPSKLLPGLTMFDPRQLFWLSYGNWWCSKATEKALEQQILVDPYLPESIRIKGSVANSKEFREVFNCAMKQPTCSLW